MPTQPAPAAEPPAAPAPVEPAIPAGFERADANFAVRFIDDGERTCSFYDQCAQVELFRILGCPSGGSIEVDALNARGTIVDWTDDLIPSMDAGERYLATLGFIGDSGVSRVELSELDCSSAHE